MPKLIMMKGLPCSGKTTEAFLIMHENPEFERMSSYNILENKTITFSAKVLKTAKLIFHKRLINKMTMKQNIIVDDLNLHPWHEKYFRSLTKKYGYEFEVMYLQQSVEECFKRSFNRKFGTPESSLYTYYDLDVIRKLNKDFCTDHAKDKEFVIYGLDDCLSDTAERRFFATHRGEFRPNVYNSPGHIYLDSIRHDVALLLEQDYDAGYDIFIVTRRPESLRRVTEEWLKINYVPYTELIMQNDLSMASEAYFKYSIVDKKFDIKLCKKIVDDNQEVLAEFEKHGIEAVDCGRVETKTPA